MKKSNQANPKPHEYPVVLRKVLDDMVISVPDLGFWKTIPLLRNESENLDSANSAKSSILNTELFWNEIKQGLVETWKYIEDHQHQKKWLPAPSTFRQSLQASRGKDFTLPEFTTELQKHMSISENTVRREIKRGAIQCYQTEGGHRRVPFEELEGYLNKHKTL